MLAVLPLLLAAQADTNPLPREAASLEKIGDVIATARICDAFGYTPDRQGLADWAAAGRDALVQRDASLTPGEAQLVIERHVVNRFKRDYVVYWRGGTWVGRTANVFIDAEYRYIHLQSKECDRLARSGEVGRYIAQPDTNPSPAAIIARVRDEYSLMRLER